jgi:ribonuclease HII
MENINELSVKEIRIMINKLNIEDKIKYIELLNKDARKSVQKIKNNIVKEKQKADDEINRINKLWDFEKNLNEGVEYVAGIDEVGRGPLAGPVVTAAVIL